MSSEDFTKKSDRVRKELNTLRKDINYRDEQEQRGEATYTIDAEINGQFRQIVNKLLRRKRHSRILTPWSTTFETIIRTTTLPFRKPTNDIGPMNSCSIRKTPSNAHTMHFSRRKPTKDNFLQPIQKQKKP